MPHLRPKDVLCSLLVLAVGCLSSLGGEQARQGSDSSVSIPLFNGRDSAGWHLHGDAKKSFWKVGTAVIDPKDSTRLVVLPGGKELVNADRHGIDILQRNALAMRSLSSK